MLESIGERSSRDHEDDRLLDAGDAHLLGGDADRLCGSARRLAGGGSWRPGRRRRSRSSCRPGLPARPRRRAAAAKSGASHSERERSIARTWPAPAGVGHLPVLAGIGVPVRASVSGGAATSPVSSTEVPLTRSSTSSRQPLVERGGRALGEEGRQREAAGRQHRRAQHRAAARPAGGPARAGASAAARRAAARGDRGPVAPPENGSATPRRWRLHVVVASPSSATSR